LRLHRFHGGLQLEGRKEAATAKPILALQLPPTLAVSMLQHAGAAAEPCVAVGDVVRRAQRIGTAIGHGTHVHAPAAGRIEAIEQRPVPEKTGHSAAHVVIAVNPKMQDDNFLPPLDARLASVDRLRERLRESGVVDLGGATFATEMKVSAPCTTLVLNGVECEPWIACDDALLRERADEVVLGGLLLARITVAERILLAIEDSMIVALDASRAAITRHGEGRIELVVVPTIYPQGGERQLVEVLTSLQVPFAGLPCDIGILVHNVATAAAAWRAVVLGEPLMSRMVTVTGPGIRQPCTIEAAIGTPIAFLVERADGYAEHPERLLLGGPMTGTAIASDQISIGKMHNCVLVLDRNNVADKQPEMPCIRCGNCASACPARLQPQQLFQYLQAGNLDRAGSDGLHACIECGICDVVCPSHIPLTKSFQQGKHRIAVNAMQSDRAQAARQRYEARGQRLQRESDQRAELELARRTALSAPDAVATALARARAKREAGKGGKAE